MPLLEYRCSACGHVFERLVFRTEGANSSNCPTCQAEGQTGQRILSMIARVYGDGADTESAASGGCCGGGGCCG